MNQASTSQSVGSTKRKRHTFGGNEKLIRDALLIGIATRVCDKKASNKDIIPYGFVAKLVKGCRTHCPTLRIDHSTIRNAIKSRMKKERVDEAGRSNSSPMVDESAAKVLLVMKSNITPIQKSDNSQFAAVHKHQRNHLPSSEPFEAFACVDAHMSTVADPSPVPLWSKTKNSRIASSNIIVEREHLKPHMDFQQMHEELDSFEDWQNAALKKLTATRK